MQTRRAGWLATAALAVGAVAGCGTQGTVVARAAEAGDGTPAQGGSAVAAKPASLRDLPNAAASARVQAARSSDSVEDSRRTAIVRAANRVAPAVVNVSVISTERVRPTSLWESFFMPPGAQRRSAGFGSGVLIRSDGIIVTNNHVVENAEKIKVTLPDGRDFDAELVGTDPVADIAVLRIHGDSLPVAPLGTSKGLLIGEWAVAIGNPFANLFSDAEPTVTAGVISAVNRNIVPSSDEDGAYLGMIQTDASINPGNSGGPLVDADGRVIGINASIFTRSGGSEGMGFAIPIDRALRVADDLVNHGEVRRAWTGLTVEAVEADAWGRTRGVRVSRVAPGSPGDKAAIEVGDKLLRANGRALITPLDFQAVLLDLRAGDSIDLDVEGQPRMVHLTAAALPSLTAPRVTVLKDMKLITVTPAIQSEEGLRSQDGAMVVSISDQLAARLGLEEGDVLVQVNGNRVKTADDAKRIFEGLQGRGYLRIAFERNGGYVTQDIPWGG